MGEEQDVVIVGAGIAGLATAVALKRVGVRALVLEKSDGLRATGAALTLSSNAWTGLDVLGVSHKLIPLYTYANFRKAYITNVANGAISEFSFSGSNENTVGPTLVHRRALLEALAEELPRTDIRFCSKLISIESHIQDGSTLLHLEDGTLMKAKVLLGCDGVHSVVAQWLGLSPPRESGRSAVRGLAVFPQGHGFNPGMYQFVGVRKRAGYIPINDKEVYWFYAGKSAPQEDAMAKNPTLIQKQLTENYCKDFPPKFLEVINQSDLSTLTWAPLLYRNPLNVLFGNVYKGTTTLVGDAMHPMTPDLGQGGCTAIEDAVVLGRHIGQSFIQNHQRLVLNEMALALKGYVLERRWRTGGLIVASYFAGWGQHAGPGWWWAFFRDIIFYRVIYSKIYAGIKYDCGKLPSIDLNDKNKLD